jgi:quinol monooxygenase YgiN
MTVQREAIAVISIQVKDYAAWRKGWEAGASIRAQYGVAGAEAFQDPDDANKVTVIDRYRDLDTLKRFLSSPELAAAQAKAGVLGAPTIIVGLAT